MTALESLNRIAADVIAVNKTTITDGRMVGQDWRADIDRLVAAHAFTQDQMSVINHYASPGLRGVFKNAATSEAIAEALKHAFQDAPGKFASNLAMEIEFASMDDEPSAEDSRNIFVNACALKKCVSDIVGNYRLILPPEQAAASDYKAVLERYENDILPGLDGLIEPLADELKIPSDQRALIDAQAADKCVGGKEHLSRIPKADWQPG